MTSAKKTSNRQGFKTNEHIVYPAHGVGQIVGIEAALAKAPARGARTAAQADEEAEAA
jgi:hypothetical protein